MAKELLYEIKIKWLDEEINSLKKLQDETKRSPSGNEYRITVDNSGNVIATMI